MGILYSEPICQAAYEDDIHQVYRLLVSDARKIDAQDESTGDTPLIAACRRGSERLAKYLLDQNADVTIRNKKQRTCLHYVARRTFSFLDYLMIAILMPILLIGYLIMEEKQRKTTNLMKTILSSKVDIDAVDNKGNTAIHYACQRRSHRLMALLLEKNADISIKNKVGF
ncbi:ankyrin repeat domain-containing protein 22 [Anguilla rostrata]|uniref:ankyrin repeat domain-containing protein 22 n=1 Tax=Anguilla rostrata TaxID=7938 RepID=UPI0030D18D78